MERGEVNNKAINIEIKLDIGAIKNYYNSIHKTTIVLTENKSSKNFRRCNCC